MTKVRFWEIIFLAVARLGITDLTIPGKRDFRRDGSVMHIPILPCLCYARKLNE
jgi:hypothetical protein